MKRLVLLHRILAFLLHDRRANISILTAISLPVFGVAIGAGVDMMRAYGDQQKLTAIVSLACQYATRPSVMMTYSTSYANKSNPSPGTYKTDVSTYVTNALHLQFNSTSNAYSATPTVNGDPGQLTTVTVTSSTSTTIMRMLGVNAVPISATSDCYNSNPLPQVNNNNTLLIETFQTSSVSKGQFAWFAPNPAQSNVTGSNGSRTVQSTFPATPNFSGANGAQWYTMGYCLEIDGQNLINNNAPGGGNSAELACDNGTSQGGASSISTQVYMAAGNYELRFFYAARIDYPDYDPAYVCGSSAADISWANDTNTNAEFAGTYQAGLARDNQMAVYLDQPLSTGAPPTHTSWGGVKLAGGNLIDVCVYAPPNGNGGGENAVWVERSVRIVVVTAGYYWLSFADDGANLAVGPQLADIRLCQGTCTGTAQDNFPSPTYNPYYPGGSLNTTAVSTLPNWLNPNGMNAGLFTESFGSLPFTSNVSGRTADKSENLNLSYGTTGSTSSGWPAATQVGWNTTPYNEFYYLKTGGASGGSYIEVAGPSGTGKTSNRLIGRPMLLVPGYYNLSYVFQSDFRLAYLSGVNSLCGATPAAAASPYPVSDYIGSNTGTIRTESTVTTQPNTTNALGVFIANAQLVSTPTSAGVSVGSASSYTNPDTNLADTPPITTTSTTPTFPPEDNISLTNYKTSTISALLDFCAYSDSWTPTSRSINFEIKKIGMYWLIFSNQLGVSQSSRTGGAIDSVVVSALGSLAMTAPQNYVPVPVGAPQPSSQLWASDSSFYIIADPPTYPAPMQ